MATDLNEFLAPVVTDACVILQLVDRGDQSAYVETDPIVVACAMVALEQISTFCNTRFEKDEFEEIYPFNGTRVNLKHLPVLEVLFVKKIRIKKTKDFRYIEELETFEQDVDFQLKKEKYIDIRIESAGVVCDFTAPVFVNSFSEYHLCVSYVGGLTSCYDNKVLFNALLLQTVANYQTKELLGVERSVNNQAQAYAIKTSLAGGNLLESVKALISSLVFYGDVEDA